MRRIRFASGWLTAALCWLFLFPQLTEAVQTSDEPCYSFEFRNCEDEVEPPAGEWDLPCDDPDNICVAPPGNAPYCMPDQVSCRPNGSFLLHVDAEPGERGFTDYSQQDHYCVLRTDCRCDRRIHGLPCRVGPTAHYPVPEYIVTEEWEEGELCWGAGVIR